MVTLPEMCSPNGRNSSRSPPLIPLCLTISSVSCEASTDTCGENARRIKSRTSLLPVRADGAGEADLTVVDPGGEYTDPLDGAVVGVPVPESAAVRGDPGLASVGKDDVDANRFDREALERRYGNRFSGSSADFAGRRFCTSIPASESESSGSSVDMGGASGADSERREGRGVDGRHSCYAGNFVLCRHPRVGYAFTLSGGLYTYVGVVLSCTVLSC